MMRLPRKQFGPGGEDRKEEKRQGYQLVGDNLYADIVAHRTIRREWAAAQVDTCPAAILAVVLARAPVHCIGTLIGCGFNPNATDELNETNGSLANILTRAAAKEDRHTDFADWRATLTAVEPVLAACILGERVYVRDLMAVQGLDLTRRTRRELVMPRATVPPGTSMLGCAVKFMPDQALALMKQGAPLYDDLWLEINGTNCNIPAKHFIEQLRQSEGLIKGQRTFDVNCVNERGQNALHLAAQLSYPSTLEALLSLLNSPINGMAINPYVHDNSGDTPMHYAVKNIRFLEAFLAVGVNCTGGTATNAEDTPLQRARVSGYQAVVDLLVAPTDSEDGDDRIFLWGCAFSTTQPWLVPTKRALRVAQVASGTNTTYFLTEDGRVMSQGENNYGEQGTGKTVTTQEPTLWVGPKNAVITQISAGVMHSMILDSNGNVYTCGRESGGRLGYNNATPGIPRQVEALMRVRVTSIAAGAAHNLVLTSAGKVLAFGSNMFGRLGIGSKAKESFVPTPIVFNDELAVIKIAAGENYSACIDANGCLWTWGFNDMGQLGLGHCNEREVPNQVTLAPVQDVACGFKHTVALLQDGRVAAFGLNEHGQIGFPVKSIYDHANPVPKILEKLPEPMVMVRCGRYHTVFLTISGVVYTCGRNTYGQLGIGLTEERDHLTRVHVIQAPVFSIGAGTESSLAIAGMRKTRDSENMSKALGKFGERPAYADVVFKIQGYDVYAHKIVLAARSSVFREMFTAFTKLEPGERKATIADLQELPAAIAEVQARTFHAFLIYMYCDRIDAIGDTAGLIQLSEFFKVDRLTTLLTRQEVRLLPSTFVDDMKLVIANEAHADVAFVLQPPPTEEDMTPAPVTLYGHRVLLAANCPYFAALFESGMAESDQSFMQLFEIEPPAFRQVLEYIYCGTVEMSPNEAIDVLPIATQYLMEHLLALCENSIIKGVDIGTVCYVHKHALMYNAQKLAAFCFQMIARSFQQVQDSETFAMLTPEEQTELRMSVRKNTGAAGQ